ncbi:hypothetical protein SDC9_90343 [bioreactor metagenome]|uniref:Asparagine synthase (glutamine-hydrolyzing) n=1 Tax=bioreactor metagenome TaxID=1076179 RepID=A0A644ZSE1_9ZZZZ|nr:asparagine synthase-related protein [Paludibacter sp.]
MHGFIAQISLKENIQSFEFEWKPLFDFQSPHIKRTFIEQNVISEQFTSEKFLSEKLWLDTKDFFIVTEGLIINIDKLHKKYKTKNYEELIRTLSDNNESFFNEFRGNFVGFYWNKKNHSFIAFNNHTGTKKLFYYHSSDYLIFSTDLYTLSKSLENLHLKKTLDINASYLLLTSGFMQDNYTLIKEVKQITAGKYADCSNSLLSIKSYFNLEKIHDNNDSVDDIIKNLDDIFEKSIQMEYTFEKKYHYTPLTTLSGGLDSRMVALMANDQNYRNQVLFNFSVKGYADEVIAKEIANAYNMPLIQVSLTSDGLLAIDDVVAVNDGLTVYSAIGHVFEAIKGVSDTQIGIVHTGILGDAILGSYLSKKKEVKPKITDGLFSTGLLSKAASILEKSISRYQNEELYKLYNRAFLGINTGFLYFDLIAETSSPFLNPDFISYAYSIPKKLKYRERIYIDWIKKRHPEYTRFVWESIGGKPNNNNLIRIIYRLKRAIMKRLPIKNMWRNNMTPEQFWYDENPMIKQYLDNYFSLHISDIAFEPKLINDMTQLYYDGNITEKTQVLTLLSAYKLLFK